MTDIFDTGEHDLLAWQKQFTGMGILRVWHSDVYWHGKNSFTPSLAKVHKMTFFFENGEHDLYSIE